MKYGLSEEQLEQVKTIIAEHKEIEEAILFGSRAIDTYKEASDVDIAVKGEKVNLTTAAKLKNELEEETYIPFFFDIIVYNTIKQEELIKHIDTKGIVIYDRSMSEWKELSLGEVVTFQRGFDITKNEQILGEYPVVSSSGIKSYHSASKVLGPGVVIGRKGTLGTVFYLRENFWPHDTTLWIRNFHDNYPLFIYYYLQVFDFGYYDVGSSNPTLNRNHIHALPSKVPPINEQKAIASVLSSFDNKIDLLHRQNKTLEAMAETLFRQWFVLNEKSKVKSEKWKEGKLPDEFNFVMGSSPPGKSYNEEGIGVPMYQGNADFNFRFPQRRIFTTEPKRFAEKYDTLISVRAPVGEQNMAKERCCIGRGVAAFRYKSDNSYYTYTYFKMKSIMDEIRQFNETGTVFGSISKGDFENIEINIPEKRLVEKFQLEAKPIDDKIVSNCFQIRTIEKLRDTLLPKLMSGEVRVKT